MTTSWQGRATIASSITDAAALALYWLAGFVLISGISTQNYPLPKNAWFCLCVTLCILGCVIMIAADVQKFSTPVHCHEEMSTLAGFLPDLYSSES